MALLVVCLTAAQSAWGATINVTSTADVATNFGACGNSAQTVPTGTSLREAICAANNAGAASTTINVAAGTYTLSNGELAMGTVSGSNITLNGAGSASTIIDGNHASRVFDLDPSVLGGVTTSISGVTITNGRDGTFGGAGLIGGGGHNAKDHLTVSNSVFSNNQANFASPSASNKPGGGISFEGGDLSITNVTFSGNQSFSSDGAGLAFLTFEAGGTLTVSNSTFSGNSTANSGASGTSGGALAVSAGAGGGTYSVSNSTFTGNTSSSSGSGEAAAGGAIFEITGNLTVTGSTFTSNSVSGSGASGGAIIYTAGTTAMHYNRFVGNTSSTGGDVMTNSGSGTADMTENWWGCNTGPNNTGCETTSGTGITASPRLVLTATASPAHVVHPSTTSTITASLLTDSAAAAVSASNVAGAFSGLPVSFADPPGDATVGGSPGAHSVNLAGGTASIGYQAGTVLGPDNVLATLDNGTSTAILEVDEPPTITSVDHATFAVNAAASFTVTTTGTPTPALSETGSLPPGMTFTDNGDGTATLGGTPTTGGSYPFTITASNGALPNATQSFTATVNASPSITSADHTTFAVGSAGSFTVTTTPGVPATTTITETGSLPSGVTFTDNGDGTATLAGTPAAGTGGSYSLTFTASNGVLPNGTQNFTLTVTELPSFTSADHTTFQVGSAGTFTVTTTAGFPAATTITESGSLPSGVTFTDNGDGSATLAGTPASGTGGTYPLTVRAANTAGHVDQAFTLTVTASALITSADHTTFTVGSAGTFTVTTAPTATTITKLGALPSGITFTDNGDGTATLAGTPATGTGGSYPLTITASNGVPPDATQSFTLTVTELPSITSANHTTFQVGSAGSFTVTTHAGFPTATTLTEAGSLPSGVTFTDNGDGTATLAGTPAAGTGGSYPLTLTATNTAGHVDQAFTLTVTASALITSADHTTFAVGSAGTFTVTTSPTATSITESGALPSGVTFHDNGNGTATLAGTPAAGTGGSYSLTFTAGNGVPPDATQDFTLTVTELPSITSANHTTFQVGSAGSFTVTTHAGFPTATTLTEAGSLPSGVTFTDNGDGTATLAGTPAAGTGGSYPLTLTATNTVGHTSQAFTLTVGASPTITSANHATFTQGTAGTFTVTTAGGYPSPPALTETGALPTGVHFTDNHNGTATLSGTPTVGGIFTITIHANNGVAPVTDQTFTLTVNGPPVFTSPNVATFLTGNNCGSYLITTTAAGSPGTTHYSETGALPSGLTFHDNGDGTATLSGCVNGITSSRTFRLTLTATNSVGSASQSFTLFVKPPAAVPLPKRLPATNGTLGGVPATTTRGQVLHLTGIGFAPGALITIGYYGGPVTITTVHASSTGTFTADITLSATGSHTFVAAGIGGNGNSRFLEAASNTVH